MRRFALGLLLVLLTACGQQSGAPSSSLTVGAAADPESVLLANVYAAALRSYGTAAQVEVLDDPFAGLDSGRVEVAPGLTGRLLQTFAPGGSGRTDEQAYRAMVAVLPEGVSAGDYATAAEDKPALAVSAKTATGWGGRTLAALVAHCPGLTVGAVKGSRPPAAVGDCALPAPREFPDDATLFDAVRAGRITAAWTMTADPQVPAELVVLADAKPALIPSENVVPLYRRNELTQQQVLALNQVAGVLDTAAIKRMRKDMADGADPRTVAEAWLQENPLGR